MRVIVERDVLDRVEVVRSASAQTVPTAAGGRRPGADDVVAAVRREEDVAVGLVEDACARMVQVLCSPGGGIS